jgi:predicted AlkP superfamily phosphohydrolase/phosphomutase
VSASQAVSGSQGVKTLLVGWDGATWTILDDMMAQGVMPFLKSFVDGGTRAKLRTIVPALTPPAWTSLMTGRTPGHHGVFDFFRFEGQNSKHIRFFTSSDILTETIWGIASKNGLHASAMNFPSMYPAPHVSGYVVPGWVPWRQMRLACWPKDLFDRLKALPDVTLRELGMDIKLEEKSTEGVAAHEEYGPWIEFHTRRERNWFEIYKYLTTTDPSELTALMFDGVDKMQHLCWRFIRPQDAQPLTEDWEFQIRELCLNYYRQLDSIFEQMVALAGPEANVLLVSDHGFGPTYEVFHVNNWLAKKGYLFWSEAAGEHKPEALLGVGQVARHTWMLDWDKTKAFATTPTSNGINIAISMDGNTPGVTPAEYPAFRARLVEELREVRSPEDGQPLISGIFTREEIFPGPAGPLGPDITLEMRDGGLVSILPGDNIVSTRPVVSGAHRPLGIFGARGPGIRKGFDAGELSILDVAPLILHSLDLPIYSDLEGRVPDEIFENNMMEQKPIHKVAASANGQDEEEKPAETESTEMSEEDERVVMERLRELGYIE